jgi:hypothetical protein
VNVDDEWATDPAPGPPARDRPAGVPALRRRYPRRRTSGPWRPAQLRPRRRPVPTRLTYGSTAQWAEQVLFPVYRRDVYRAGLAWCPRWWAHPEVISRLEALWRAWEHLRLDPALGMGIWWRDYADPTMAALLNMAGPFTACRANRHHDRDPMPPLPHEPAPAALFPDLRVRPEPEMWRHRHGRR